MRQITKPLHARRISIKLSTAADCIKVNLQCVFNYLRKGGKIHARPLQYLSSSLHVGQQRMAV